MNSFNVSLRLFLSVLVIALFASMVSGAGAADAPISLGIKPVGVSGSYFTLNMSPGETRQLTVALGNFGTEKAEAKTFAADAYSIVNGGFGVRLDGEATSGTTTWLSYPAETLQIEAGKSETRTFNVSIPADANPGEYITGMVIQNATPTAPSSSGSVAINQINRQAIAVAITVPGPLVAGVAINQIAYKAVGERSVLSFGVANTGNMHLKPAGEFVLKTPDGQEIAHGAMQMDSFYAGTATNVEGLLAQKLNPGDYVAALTLTDAASGATATKSLELNVPVPAVGAANTSSASNGATVNQTAAQETANDQSTNVSQRALLGAGVVVLVGLFIILLILLRRRRIGRSAPNVADQPQPTTSLRNVAGHEMPKRPIKQPISLRKLEPRVEQGSPNAHQNET